MQGMSPDGASELVQGTREWKLVRCGKVTASRVQDIIATVKSGGLSAGYKNYMAELVAERLTGEPAEKFQSPAMAYGAALEAEARNVYAFMRNTPIVEVGFVKHPLIREAGCSPDGLVGDEGMVEIKCPGVATHIDTLLRGVIPIAYATQMHFQMACTGRRWCDFVSYDNRMPEHMRLWVRRVQRDQAIIEQLDDKVSDFLAELASTIDQLQRAYPAPAEAA